MSANIQISSETAKPYVDYTMSVIQGGNPQTMTSLQIAEITGKRHSDVMRDVRNLLEQGVQERNFALSYTIRELPNGGSKQEPYYNLTKTGCLILASGYNALLREKIIDRWEELESGKATPTAQLSRKELALMVVQAEEEKERLLIANEHQQATIERQEQTIKEQAPKVSYYDTTLQSVNTLTTTQIAKELGLDAPKLNQRLKAAGVLFRQSGVWMLRQPYSAMGLTATRTQTYTRSDGSTGTSMYTVWTERGRRFIHTLHDCDYSTRKARKEVAL